MLDARTLKKTVDYREMIDVLMGDNSFADKVLQGGTVINVLTRKSYKADVAIKGEYIALVGDCKGLIGDKTEVIDVSGKYISPGFIDSHMHFESSMLTITEFSRMSIPTGTTTLIGDPHEIGNVLGPLGMKAMADEASVVPNHVYLPVPAITPDCPALETAGYDTNSKDMKDLLNYKNVIGIGEFQGFSNARHVYNNTPEIVSDLVASAVYASSIGKIVDGNAPELFGADLAAHIVSCAGECSCHETTTKAEALEKLDQGVYMFMREGSTQRNMAECIKAVTEEGYDSRRCILATDDMLAVDLEGAGHMDDIIKRTIAEGVDPIEAIQMATINAATYFGFKDKGVLAPAKLADIAVISDLNEMVVDSVYLKGQLVAKDKKLLIDLPKYTYPDSVKNSVKRGPVSLDEIALKADGDSVTARCIVCIPDQNLTGKLEVELKVENGIVQGDISKDIIPMICVERHGRTKGNVGKTFVNGIGLKEGAFAESVSHDTHNIIATGANYEDIVVAINRVIEMGGGLALVKDGKVIDELALPVGGLITDELEGSEVSAKMKSLEAQAKEDLGCTIHAPFMHVSFLSLSTSPTWKLTDKGLVNVNEFEILSPIV